MNTIYWLTEDESAIENGPHRWPTQIARYGVRGTNAAGITEAMIREAYGRPAPGTPIYNTNLEYLGPVILNEGKELEYAVIKYTPEELWGLFEDKKQTFIQAVQYHMDSVARSNGFDSVLSLCSYHTSDHPTYGPQGRAGVLFRDGCWDHCLNTVLPAVVSGEREEPTKEELILELPVMQWP